MKKKVALIFLTLLFFTSLAAALPDDLFSDTSQAESVEELSSKIGSYLPHTPPEDAAEIAEAIKLIKELEREIFLTNELLEITAPITEDFEKILSSLKV